MLVGFYFFFFQAEDGIRDLTVTGVQTCALPISVMLAPRAAAASRSGDPRSSGGGGARRRHHRLYRQLVGAGQLRGSWHAAAARCREIGRASCRGKRVVAGARGVMKRGSEGTTAR